jgi:hypothetical protein
VVSAPFRFGLEFFDPATDTGVMASMDLNGGDGARVIMLLPDGRVALCTAEGKLELRRNRITRGPIRLITNGNELSVEFDGPALVVPNAAAYLRMEQALETGSIDHSAAFNCTLDLRTASGPICFDPQFLTRGSRRSGYGLASGAVTINGVTRPLAGLGKAGVSLLVGSERPFASRCSLWGYFPDGPAALAIEARRAVEPEGKQSASGLVLDASAAADCRVEGIHTEPWTPGRAPSRIEATLMHRSELLRITALPRCFMALSRPGPAATRVFTSLGFARFELNGSAGAGMFECSKAVSPGDNNSQ